MTEPHPDQGHPGGAPAAGGPAGAEDTGSFGDAAGEMGNWTEVETQGGATPPSGATAEGADAAAPDDPLAVAEAALAERTSDLQRLQAEFLNYKRRVERDRDLIRENARYDVLAPITEVLDTIDRAREHGELDEGLRAVADQLEAVVNRLGLTKYAVPGDPFDPTIHDALSHLGTDPAVDVPTAKLVAKAGYKIGDRVVRAAQVLVVDPES